MMAVYIIVNQGATWHVCKKRAGSNPVYSIIATTRSETNAREILAALIYQNKE